MRAVSGVTFLPEKLRRPQEEPRAQLPAHNVVPQVEQQRQVAIGLDPVLDHFTDDGLAGRADGQPLG